MELLKKLWLEGLSASQIAGVLGEGVTRNAVIGKVHRLKLTGRAKPASSTPRARTAPRAPGIRRVSGGSGGVSRPSSGIASMMKSRSMPSGGGGMTHGATALKIDSEFEVEAYVAPQVQELLVEGVDDDELPLLARDDAAVGVGQHVAGAAVAQHLHLGVAQLQRPVPLREVAQLGDPPRDGVAVHRQVSRLLHSLHQHVGVHTAPAE